MGIMAIPAQIPVLMRIHVDSGNLLGTLGALSMAFTAEFPFHRLFGFHKPGIGKMLFGDGMALQTWQYGMMRNHFLAGNLAVAGAAVLRFMRQKRIMRIVTRYAYLAGIMHHRNYLGESGWSRQVVAMAKGAESPFPRRVGSKLIGSLDMLRRRTMTDLTCNPPMI